MERENIWTLYNEDQLKELEVLSESYKTYLDKGKTERECIKEAVKMAKAAGYQDLEELKKAIVLSMHTA